eukprot:TRINITY_DN13865_c0_g2_i1.p1 TRINITY_DN13865_c0_g2~~TRINITY_DN13865_c0_g2_i1.p1  ORF type:complete len:190 (+),score=19.56 TRINITY_DN13865_c0_g2_i1:68-571(+)
MASRFIIVAFAATGCSSQASGSQFCEVGDAACLDGTSLLQHEAGHLQKVNKSTAAKVKCPDGKPAFCTNPPKGFPGCTGGTSGCTYCAFGQFCGAIPGSAFPPMGNNVGCCTSNLAKVCSDHRPAFCTNPPQGSFGCVSGSAGCTYCPMFQTCDAMPIPGTVGCCKR